MKMTPLDIRQQQFPSRFRGFDPVEVDSFLELVAGEMEDLLRENARLREAFAKQDQEMQRMRQGDDGLKKALMAFQQVKEDLLERARKEAEQILAEAAVNAKRIVMDAEQRLESLQHEVQELEHRRRQLIFQMRGILEEHLKLMEAEEGEGEDSGPDDVQRPLLEASDALTGAGELGRGESLGKGV